MTQLDVRIIPPRDRHPISFNIFDNLKPGESFELVNDHAPKPLYYQFCTNVLICLSENT